MIGGVDKIKYVSLPDPKRFLQVESLSYNNPYDFHQLHRHDYFEVVFVQSGNGYHNIDFKRFDISAGNIYIIYPGQVHLMNRGDAEGLLIQFRKDIFEYIHPLKHYHFYNRASEIEVSESLFSHLYDLCQRINAIYQQKADMNMVRHKAFSYLQIILICLLEQQHELINNNKGHQTLSHYLSLLEGNITENRKVAEYADMIGCSPDKLNEVCKSTLGKTASEILHEELLLEIRRMLLLDQLSLKELTYKFNFENQANFNAYIKSKTGLSPGELQKQVLEFYK